MTRSSHSVFVTIAIPARTAPSALEPTSPMNTDAGCALNQANPAHAPATAAATAAISGRPSFTATAAYAPEAIATVPAARPSSPSVRLTALANPTTYRMTKIVYAHPSCTAPTPGRVRPVPSSGRRPADAGTPAARTTLSTHRCTARR